MCVVTLFIVMVSIMGVHVGNGSVKGDTATTQLRVPMGVFVTWNTFQIYVALLNWNFLMFLVVETN